MRADVRFYAELRSFLPREQRPGFVSHGFDVSGSVKDVIESWGVPHSEVELILANGVSVDFSYRVRDGDRISVFPTFEAFDVSPLVKVRPEPLREMRFVLDGHLGKLARYLRLLGFDALCNRDWSDHELVEVASEQHRLLLTRDVGLLKHRAVTHGSFVRSADAREQLIEVVRRFHLSDRVAPFARCMSCNGHLDPVAKRAVIDRLPPRTREHYDDFWACRDCEKVYWRGAHHAALWRLVEEASAAE